MDKSTLISSLNCISNYSDFTGLNNELNRLDKPFLFNTLFELAISNRNELPAEMAGYCLVALEPKFTRNCNDLINEIATSDWYLSDKSIPLYLNSQFGKWTVKSSIDEILSDKELTRNEKIKIEGIWYWSRMPNSYLSGDLCYWQWQEAIEGNENT